MIKKIDDLLCVDCGLCENVCPMDIFRSQDGHIYIAFQDDCCSCMRCLFICPADAIEFTPGVPKKFDGKERWNQIKEFIQETSSQY